MKAFENLAFDKENFESYIDQELNITVTDEQWAKVVDELNGRVENFIDELVWQVVQDFEEGMFDEHPTLF